MVNGNDGSPVGRTGTFQLRLSKCQDQQEQDDQLQKQKQAVANSLKRSIGPNVFDGTSPQHGAWYVTVNSTELEKIEQQQRRHRKGRDEQSG